MSKTYNQPPRGEEAIEILRATRDGEDLSPGHLGLLQSAVNHHLTEEGLQAFDALHGQVLDGTYKRPYLFDIEHLTISHEGYVYWKEVHRVEHYTFYGANAYETLRVAAIELARRCLILESMKVTPTISTVLKDELFT